MQQVGSAWIVFCPLRSIGGNRLTAKLCGVVDRMAVRVRAPSLWRRTVTVPTFDVFDPPLPAKNISALGLKNVDGLERRVEWEHDLSRRDGQLSQASWQQLEIAHKA